MLHAFGGGTADNAGDAQRVIVVNVDRKHQLQILELFVKLDEPALRSKAKDIENMEQTSIHALITYGGTKVSSQKRYTLGLSSVSPFYDHEVPEMSKYQMRIDVNSCKKAQGTTHLASNSTEISHSLSSCAFRHLPQPRLPFCLSRVYYRALSTASSHLPWGDGTQICKRVCPDSPGRRTGCNLNTSTFSSLS